MLEKPHMYCPRCGTQNLDSEELRFCRSCGADLRAVSRAINKSLPVRIASTLDAYFANRYQQNLRNGVLNVLAFVFLLIVAAGYLIKGSTFFGLVMLVLSIISIVTGVWDIWIYRRNLPPIAKRTPVPPIEHEQLSHPTELFSLGSVTERTTKNLNAPRRRSD